MYDTFWLQVSKTYQFVDNEAKLFMLWPPESRCPILSIPLQSKSHGGAGDVQIKINCDETLIFSSVGKFEGADQIVMARHKSTVMKG